MPTKGRSPSTPIHLPRLREAIAHHEAGRHDEARAGYLQILRSQPGQFEANLFLGTLYLEKGEANKSIPHLALAVRSRLNHQAAWHYYALALEQAYRPDEAGSAFEAALQLGTPSQRLLVQAARFFLGTGQLSRAGELYQQMIEREPRSSEAHYGLGEVARLRGDVAQAIERFQQAIAIDAGSFPSLMNLGLLLNQEGRLAEAIDVLRQAISVSPSSIEAKGVLASCLARMDQTKEAMELASLIFAQAPNHPMVHECLAHVYEAQGNSTQAIHSWAETVRLRPDSVRHRMTLGRFLLTAGYREQAKEQFEAAWAATTDIEPAVAVAQIHEQADQIESARSIYHRLAVRSNDAALWNLRSACAIPTVLAGEEEIETCRSTIHERLADCRESGSRRSIRELVDAGIMPPFNLAFHHQDDRRLREEFANTTRGLLGLEPVDGPVKCDRSRLRVGFYCAANERTFARSLGGLIGRLDQTVMEPIVIGSPSAAASLRLLFRSMPVGMVGTSVDPERALAQIRSLDLDLLVYFEVGTAPIGYLLAQHRLARVQVATWGIQVTTGIPAIDYYLSSDLIEVESASNQYSERLVRGKSLLTLYPPIPKFLNRIRRSDLGWRNDGSIYLCPQQLGKFTPRFDRVMAEILRQDVRGEIVVTEGNVPDLVARLQQRWRRSIPDVVDRIRFVPQAKGNEYATLLTLADVLLDPIDFGGVNTTYDAFAYGKVVVTLPSEYQRTRYASACYRAMGIDEPIARSEEEYVSTAVRLATHPQERAPIEKKIEDRNSEVFLRFDSVGDVQSILIDLARGESSW
jgi:predicted O-linked N-acetylglucosamine transferase (SPINDLY family)